MASATFAGILEIALIGEWNPLLRKAIEPMGIHPPGDDGRDPDAISAAFDPEPATESNEPPLRRVIGGGVSPGAQGSGRCNIDDIPAGQPLHDRKDRFGDEERSAQIDTDHSVPLRDRHLLDAEYVVDTGAIDGDVDAVPGLECAVDGCLHGAFITDVAADGDRPGA